MKKINQSYGIITNEREIIDLAELFVLLTYQCNGNCPYCIERKIGEKGFMSEENFDKALAFAKEKGLNTIFLHGGEPTVHPNVVKFAQKAKDVGFTVKMFTNGILHNRVKELDGIVDEITISYRDKNSLSFKQEDFKSKLTLQVLVTEEIFPTFDNLKEFLNEAKMTGMYIRINTLNPVNQWAYDHQYVSYLEDYFLNLPDDEILCASNKAMFWIDGIGVRMSNKSLNPGHLKYSMTPKGVIQTKFERFLDEIVKNKELEKKLQPARDKLNRILNSNH